MKRWGTRAALAALLVLAASSARAQTGGAPAPPGPGAQPPPPPGQPPPAAQPAPPAPAAQPQPQPYPYPQPYPQQPYPYPYAQPYPYPYPYAARPLPAEIPYDPEKPIPPGYKLEEHTRKGAVIAGAIVAGVPYVIGLNIAAASGFHNKSYWLVVPGIGPFLTLQLREDSCDDRNNSSSDAADCLGDIFMAMLLVTDGLMQTAGGVVLAVGLLAKKQVLVREQTTLRVGPVRVGRGHGLGLYGTF